MSKYNYPNLEKVDTEIGRFYKDSNQKLVPSVTTVLSNTSNNSSGILEWRMRVGDEEADRIIKQSTDIGTAVHLAIENYLYKKEWNTFGTTYEEKISEQITKRFISDGLNKITEVWGLSLIHISEPTRL